MIALACPQKMSQVPGYNLTLRCLAAGARFEHVAHVLYHWRVHPGSTADGSADSKPYAIEAGRLALQRHFNELGICGTVRGDRDAVCIRMRYALPEPAPLVSIVIPTKDHVETLDACVMSIAQKATYSNYEIVLVENNSEPRIRLRITKPCQNAWLKHQKARVSRALCTGRASLNTPQIINFGVEHAKGDYLLLLNNDTEVISPDFIEEMMGYLQRPDAAWWVPNSTLPIIWCSTLAFWLVCAAHLPMPTKTSRQSARAMLPVLCVR